MSDSVNVRRLKEVDRSLLEAWHKRGLVVARRLKEHGCAASCTLEQGETADGQEYVGLTFEHDVFVKIVLAEVAAGALDELRDMVMSHQFPHATGPAGGAPTEPN